MTKPTEIERPHIHVPAEAVTAVTAVTAAAGKDCAPTNWQISLVGDGLWCGRSEDGRCTVSCESSYEALYEAWRAELADLGDEQNLKRHPLAAVGPETTPEDFGRLRNSIARYGYLHDFPIVVYQQRILDGKQRYRICRELGLTPTFRVFGGARDDALGYVIAANLARRHITQVEAKHLVTTANMSEGMYR